MMLLFEYNMLLPHGYVVVSSRDRKTTACYLLLDPSIQE